MLPLELQQWTGHDRCLSQRGRPTATEQLQKHPPEANASHLSQGRQVYRRLKILPKDIQQQPKDNVRFSPFLGSTFRLLSSVGQCAQMVPSVLPLSPCYTPICRLISTCLYFFHSSFVIHSCLLFRFQPLGSEKNQIYLLK